MYAPSVNVADTGKHNTHQVAEGVTTTTLVPSVPVSLTSLKSWNPVRRKQVSRIYKVLASAVTIMLVALREQATPHTYSKEQLSQTLHRCF